MKCPPPQRFVRRVLLNAALVLVLSFNGRAASADDYWDAEFGVPGASAQVTALNIVGSDLYAVGGFTNIGGTNASRVARFDGMNWHPLGDGISSPTDMTVRALAFVHSSLYAGGVFTQAGANSANNIARWDGTNWFPCGAGVNGIVRAMAVTEDRLIVAGTFTAAGGILATNIAAWNGTNWAPIGSGISGTAIDSLAVTGTTIYAGGRFRVGAGINATNIARWDGTTWSGLGEGIRVSNQGTSGGQVNALLVTAQGLFAAGSFRMAGRTNAISIARWDGTNWWALGSGIDASGGIYALSISGTDLYVGGFFSSAGTSAANGIAKWTGSDWFVLGTGVFFEGWPGVVNHLVADGADLYVGGGFDHVGGNLANNIAVWHIPHALSVSCSEDTVTLSWPATGTNLVLEAKESVADTNWSMVSTVHAIVGDQCRVTNQISSPSRFFRLRRK